MVIYFANRKMDTLGMATTELREGFTISNDLKIEDTDTGVATFECTVHWTEDTRALVEDATAAGNYLLRSYNYDNEFYTIIESIIDTKAQTVEIYAEDAGMDLLNETVGAFSADQAYSAAWYVEKYAMDTGFEIGINEIENLSRTLKWEGEATAAERIASVATEFDNAEISYSFDIQGLTITHKYINIHKKRGKDAGVQFRLNRDVDRIVTTTSVANLATALYVTGGTEDGSEDPITLDGYSYDDGDIYVEDGLLKSREALAVWSRYVWAKEPNQIEGYTGHIVKQWSYDTTSQSELCNRAITQLKKVCEPAVNYEIDIQQLPENVGIGDYVDIVDEKGELYLSSRILQLTTSACDQKQTATLGEFLIKESGISQTVKDLADQFSQLANSRTYYVWIVYADDAEGNGISLDPEGKTYMGTCTTSAGPDPDLSDPTIYKWSLIQGENGAGIETINTYYGISDSPADIPTVWQDEPINDLGNNQCQWSYTEIIYTNGVIELTSPTIIAYYSYLEVDELVAQVANIESLLAGEVGTGILQTIHLTGENAVIDEAVIINATMDTAVADLLVSSKIYTDYVQIANNTEENGQYLWIDHSTIQINDGTYVRVQIGEDGDGDYNMYLWDADGSLLWNAKGLTEQGVSGNGGIIKDVAVADDAAIQGHKLDIQSVASELSEDGTITINAGNVYIGGDKLDYMLQQMQEQITGLEGITTEGMVYFYPVYAIWDSDTEAPEEEVSIWTEEQPTQLDGSYLWMKYICVYYDGHTEETPAILITDSFLRSTTTVLQTSLEIVNGEIEALVAQTTTIGGDIADIYATIDVLPGQISAEVEEVIYNELNENYATKASLVLQVNPESGHAEMIADADYIYLYGNQIVIESDNFTLSADGSIHATSGHFENAYVEGTIESTSGHIGGWTIGTSALYNGKSSASANSNGIYLGASSIALGPTNSLGANAMFYVNSSGTVYAENIYLGSALYLQRAISDMSSSKDYIKTLSVDPNDSKAATASDTSLVIVLNHAEFINYVTMDNSLSVEGHVVCGSSSSVRYVRCIGNGGSIQLYSSGNDVGIYVPNASAWICAYGPSNNEMTMFAGASSIPLRVRGSSIVLASSKVTLSSGAAVTSDRQMKEKIAPLEPVRADDLTDKLTPRIYTLKDDPETKHIGLVVDEVEDAMRAAGYDPDEYGITTRYEDEDEGELGAIRYEEFIPILLYEIQELRDRVNTLENPEEGLIDPGI